MVQVNVKVERVSAKKLDDVLSHQKPFSDKTRLGYTRESSSVVNISKEVKFVKAKESSVVTYYGDDKGWEEEECGWPTGFEQAP